MATIPIDYRVQETGAKRTEQQFRKLAQSLNETSAAGQNVASFFDRGTAKNRRLTTAIRQTQLAEDGLSRAIVKQGVAAKASSGATAGLQARIAGLSRTASLAIGPLSGVGSRLAAVSGAIGAGGVAGAGLIGLIAGTAVGLGAAARRADSAQRSFARIDAIIKSTGGSAGVTRKEINTLAIDIGRGTLASVEGVRDAAGALLTFRTVGKESFGDVLRTAQDLSAVFGGDLQENVVRLGRALEDPEQGLNALRRVGVTLTDSQRDLILNLQRTGQVAEAQRETLKLLAAQVGGAGAAEASGSLAGAADTAGENFGLLLEKIGESSGIVPGITKLFQELALAIQLATPSDSPRELLGANTRAITELERLEQSGGGDTQAIARERNRLIEVRRGLLREIANETAQATKDEETSAAAIAQANRERADALVISLEDNLALEASRQRQRDLLEADLTFLRSQGIEEEKIAAIRKAGLEALRDPAEVAAERKAAQEAARLAQQNQNEQIRSAEQLSTLTRTIQLERIRAIEPLEADLAALQDQVAAVQALNVATDDEIKRQEALVALRGEQARIAGELADATDRATSAEGSARGGLEKLARVDPEQASDIGKRFNEALANAEGVEARAEVAEEFAEQISEALKAKSEATGKAIGDAIVGAMGTAFQSGDFAGAGIQLGADLGAAFGDSVGGLSGSLIGSGAQAAALLGQSFLGGGDAQTSTSNRARSAVTSVEAVRGIVAGGNVPIATLDRNLRVAVDPLIAINRRQLAALEAIESNTSRGVSSRSSLPAVGSLISDSSESLA